LDKIFLKLYFLTDAFKIVKSRDSSVDIATGYNLDGRGSIPGRDNIFSLVHSAQNGSGAHAASYQVNTELYFPGVKVAGV
jgi:hypothetical protein